MRLNLRLMRASQFLQQFKLNVCHKSGKEHIVPDALSRLISANTGYADPHYSELDTLFTYSTMLVKVYPALISQILASYKAVTWWIWLLQQIQANQDLGADATILPFVIGSTPPTDSDFYLPPRPNGKEDPRPSYIPAPKNPERLPKSDKAKLLYHVNRLTKVHRLCIPPSVTPDILAIAHGEGNLGFSRCYEIITCS